MKLLPNAARFQLLFLACGLLVLLGAGCSTTVRPVQESSERLEALHKLAATQNENRLEGLSYEELLHRGNSMRAAGNDQLARLHYAKALEKRSDSIPALMGLGTIARKHGQGGQALFWFSQVLEHEPEHPRALTAIGVITRETGNPAEALQYLHRARAGLPDDLDLIMELAVTYDLAGQEDQAEPIFRWLTEQRPHSAHTWNNRGFNYLLQKKYHQAVESLEEAVSLAPRDKRIINNLAMALALRGDEQRAFALLLNSVGEAGAYNNLGYTYMLTGQYDKAEKAFLQALESNSRYYVRARENLDRLRVLRESPSPR